MAGNQDTTAKNQHTKAENQHDVQIEAMGRTFRLGKLYDCRRDELISGIRLWPHDALQKHVQSDPHPDTRFRTDIENSLLDKVTMLNVGGSLKLGILGGLVSVSGSAEYAKDHKKTNHQGRVVLKYSATVRSDELIITDLDKANLNDVQNVDITQATHIVTEIIYGVDAYFVFTRELSQDEDKTEVEGEIKAVVKKLPSIEVSADAELKLKDNEQKIADSLTCTFYGDFNLVKNPSTFDEALKLYQALPKLLGDKGENAVPKTVNLMPLSSLVSGHNVTIREISNNLIDNCVKFLDDLHELKVQANDLSSNDNSTARLRNHHLKKFAGCITKFEDNTKQKMMTLLPKIRGDVAKEVELADFLQEINMSSFNVQKLEDWIKSKETEIRDEKELMQDIIKDDRVDSSECSLRKARVNLECDLIICLCLYLTEKEDAFLEELDHYVKEGKIETQTKIVSGSWLDDENIYRSSRKNAKLFRELLGAHPNMPKTKFIINEEYINDKENLKGVLLHSYEDGEKKNIEIPSKPGKPIATEIQCRSIRLKWTKPSSGSDCIEFYKIIYKKKHAEQWEKNLSPIIESESQLIENLHSNTEYIFKVQVTMRIGIIIESDESDPIATKPSGRNEFSYI